VATVTARARAPAMACVDGLGRLGRTSAGDSLRCNAARGAVASKPLLGPCGRCSERPDDSANAENASLAQLMRSPLHWNCTGGGACIRATMPHPRGGYGRRFGRSAVCAASRRRSHIGSTSEVSLCVGKLESRLKTQDHKGPLNSRLKITQHLLTHDSRSLSNS
jgi:hypothetical protein